MAFQLTKSLWPEVWGNIPHPALAHAGSQPTPRGMASLQQQILIAVHTAASGPRKAVHTPPLPF